MDQSDSRRKIAISGATGFLGRAVAAAVVARGHEPVVIQQRAGFWQQPAEMKVLARCLAGCDALINCAGRAHVTARQSAEAEWAAFVAVNRDLPLQLAQAAREAGLGRFVHVSSVAALASSTAPGETIDDSFAASPETPYGRSKLEGDRAVLDLATDGFAVVVMRPPALFGPGAKGWFPAFMRAARLGMPLPLGALANRRSLAFVGNVADALVNAATGTSVPSGAYVVCDSAPLSSGEFYDRLCRAHGHRGRVWRLPPSLAKGLARIVLADRAASLVGNAAFDGSRFIARSGWAPPFTLDQAMTITATGRPC